VVILDPTEFGDLVQYKVDEDKPDYPLSFSVKEISREQAKGYLVKYPELTNIRKLALSFLRRMLLEEYNKM